MDIKEPRATVVSKPAPYAALVKSCLENTPNDVLVIINEYLVPVMTILTINNGWLEWNRLNAGQAELDTQYWWMSSLSNLPETNIIVAQQRTCPNAALIHARHLLKEPEHICGRFEYRDQQYLVTRHVVWRTNHTHKRLDFVRYHQFVLPIRHCTVVDNVCFIVSRKTIHFIPVEQLVSWLPKVAWECLTSHPDIQVAFDNEFAAHRSNLYVANGDSLYVFDTIGRSWTLLQQYNPSADEPRLSPVVTGFAIVKDTMYLFVRDALQWRWTMATLDLTNANSVVSLPIEVPDNVCACMLGSHIQSFHHWIWFLYGYIDHPVTRVRTLRGMCFDTVAKTWTSHMETDRLGDRNNSDWHSSQDLGAISFVD